VESEFFGHTRGAFTGADKVRKGLFLEADGGTIFLDEIGELPLALQVKLLHVIEQREVRPVGGEQTRTVDVRIIAATNRDLGEMVALGTFREDLYFRLSVFHIHVPPLRERRQDLPGLVDFLLKRNTRRMDSNGEKVSLDKGVEELLVNYDWPGNVRELENVIDRAMILADENLITAADLPPLITKIVQTSSHPNDGIQFSGTLREQIKKYEAFVILRTIEDAAGDRRAAAQILNIGLSSLYRKLEELEAEKLLPEGNHLPHEIRQG
jgi:two-component system response regulator AtoC